MKKTLIGILVFSCSLTFAQEVNRSITKHSIWSYILPETEHSGPMDVSVDFEYYFVKETSGGDTHVNINYKLKLTYTATFGALRYKYKNRIYRQDEMHGTDGLSMVGFDKIKITLIDIQISVDNIGNSFSMNSSYDNVYNIGSISKDLDLNHLNLSLVGSRANRINFDDSFELTARIDKMEKLMKDRDNYKELINKADISFKSKNWEDAKVNYSKASTLLYKELYPKEQLDKIKEIENDEKANQKLIDEKKESSSNNTEASKNNKNTTTDKAASNASKSTNTAVSNESNTTKKSNPRNPNVVNGIDRSKLPKYAKEATTGKYYEKDEDNNYHEISYDEYTQAKKKETEGKLAEARAKKQQQDQELIKKTKDELQASTNKYWADVEETQRKSEISYQNKLTSYYAAKAVDEAKGQIRDNSRLSGNYTNAAELQADYRQKYQALTQGYQTLQEANTQKNQANLNIYNQNTDENGRILGQLATDVSNYVGQMQAEAAERKAKKELREQRDAAEARLIKLEKANLLELRKKFFSQFPDGGLPLSSHPVNSNELYFFSYVFNPNAINDNYPTITLSNVFPIAKYNDGTWLFKNRLISELTKTVTGSPITLMGYYTTRAMADEMRNAFVTLANTSKMGITEFQYKGKPATSESSANVDYWGNGTNENGKQHSSDTNEDSSSPQSEKIDFWGNPINSETKKTPAKKPASKPSQTKAKTDFWGNPIK